MATYVEPLAGLKPTGKHPYKISQILFDIETKYKPIKLIGKGSYGAVCSSTNQETNEKVAIKKITGVFYSPVESVRTLREIKILRQANHQNVIKLKDIMLPRQITTFNDVYLVYDLMDTDLRHVINSSELLSDAHCKHFMFQLLLGLRYLHSANVIHRDLKPANLLVNKDCHLKICDFGLSRTFKGEFMTEQVGTRPYRAPELLVRSVCTPSIDVWSAGCIFAEILGRRPIFSGEDDSAMSQLKLIVSILGSPSDHDLGFIDNPKARNFIKSLPFSDGLSLSAMLPLADPLAMDLLRSMLMFDPGKRISVEEALCHPYMDGLFDPDKNPVAGEEIDLDFDEEMSERMMREMMLKEMMHYHPELEADYPNIRSSL